MADLIDTLAQVQNLLRENQTQAADDLVTQEIETQRAAAVAAGTMPATPAAPREPQIVLEDLLAEIVGLLGNKDSLLKLLGELHEVS